MSDSDFTDFRDKPTRRLTREELRKRKPAREGYTNKKRTPIVLIFDGVEGNYNKGALFRLADAFLIEKMHFCHTRVEHWHRRFVKASRGTFKWVPYEMDEDTIDVIASYRKRGYRIVVAEQCEGSCPLEQADLSGPVCIVLGGELSGVSSAVVRAADQVIELPCLGMANSLNVSMTAGMMALAAYQQLKR